MQAFEKTVESVEFGGFRMEQKPLDFGQIDGYINGLIGLDWTSSFLVAWSSTWTPWRYARKAADEQLTVDSWSTSPLG